MNVIDKIEPVEKVYTIELSQSEVDMIKVLLGQVEASGPSSNMYKSFKGISTGKYHVSNESKVPPLKIVKI